jgi:hypothetical protein
MDAIAKAESQSKSAFNKVGWHMYFINAVECGAFGNLVEDIENIDCEKIFAYFHVKNGLISSGL